MLLTLQHTWLLVIIDYFTQAHAIKKFFYDMPQFNFLPTTTILLKP